MNNGVNGENLIGGTEACSLLGIPKKKGKQHQLLAEFGLRPVFSKRVGRGLTTFYELDKVQAAASKAAAARPQKAATAANRFIPTAEALAVMTRIEAKIDRLISIWDDKQ